MPGLTDRYAWAQEELELGCTIAVIRGREPHEVVRLYGGDPGRPVGRMRFAEAVLGEDASGSWFEVQVLEADGAVVAVENNGWRGSSAGVAVRCSAGGGAFASAYWNVNALHQLTEAENGVLIARFNPMFLDEPAGAADLVPSWVRPADFDTDLVAAACLAALERRTGVAVDRGWFDRELPTYRLSAVEPG